jgi:5-formyltetrahydrofolate cyclo-ligase
MLLSLEEYVRAECIALYAAVRNETDTGLILAEAIKAGKRVLYPVVCGNQMEFHQVETADVLQKGTFGIPEPTPSGACHQITDIDMIVVPGVVFDLSGHRIGYGKGYYDRCLQQSGCRANTVGLCHDFQLLDEKIPADSHDITMEIIVSETRIIRISSLCPGT